MLCEKCIQNTPTHKQHTNIFHILIGAYNEKKQQKDMQ